jgi:hypothetical protein
VEKRVQSSLLESSSIEKIMEIDAHIGCAMSGLTADARTMVEHARMTGQMHAFTYDEPIGVESVAQAVCDLALRFGESVDDDDAMMVGVLSHTTTYRDADLSITVTAVRCRLADSRYRFTRPCTVSPNVTLWLHAPHAYL